VALTSKQKHKVVFYLGWSGLTLVANSTQYNSVVNDRLGSTLNADIENLVKGLLERLEMLDKALEEAICRLSASSVDNIEMNPKEIEMLKKERMRLIRELSDHLDIPIMKSSAQNMSVIA
jgi:hypothetical protein